MSEETMEVDSGAEEVIESGEESQEIETSEEQVAEEESYGEEQVEVAAETEQELQEEIKEAVEEGASEEEVANMIRSFTLKVNGKEMVKEIDLSDEEALKKELQLAAAGRIAMNKSAELEKLYSSEVNRLKQNPFQVLEELGLNPLDLSAEYLERFLKEQEKSPEQKEAEARQKEMESLREERDRLKKQAEEKERAAMIAQAEKEIENDVMSALEGEPDLPKTPKVIGKVADMMLWAIENGYSDVTAKDVIPTVKKELRNEVRDVINNISDIELLKELLGKDVTDKFREQRIEQAKKASNIKNLNMDVAKGKLNEQKKSKKRMKLSDFMS